MQLVWTKYLSLYKGNDCCRTKSFILLVERFLYFLFRFYYLSLLWEKIFYIFFDFSRCCFMLLYKTFWDLYKTEYFLYKRRRKLLHVFSESPVFFIQASGFFLGVPCFFEWQSPVFSFTYPFFKSVFYLVGYDSLVSFPSVCLFLRIFFDKKSIFSEWTILPVMHLFYFRLDIFIFFRMLRQIFLSWLASFSAFFPSACKK